MTIAFEVLESTCLSLIQSLYKNLSHGTGRCQSSLGFCTLQTSLIRYLNCASYTFLLVWILLVHMLPNAVVPRECKPTRCFQSCFLSSTTNSFGTRVALRLTSPSMLVTEFKKLVIRLCRVLTLLELKRNSNIIFEFEYSKVKKYVNFYPYLSIYVWPFILVWILQATSMLHNDLWNISAIILTHFKSVL